MSAQASLIFNWAYWNRKEKLCPFSLYTFHCLYIVNNMTMKIRVPSSMPLTHLVEVLLKEHVSFEWIPLIQKNKTKKIRALFRKALKILNKLTWRCNVDTESSKNKTQSESIQLLFFSKRFLFNSQFPLFQWSDWMKITRVILLD